MLALNLRQTTVHCLQAHARKISDGRIWMDETDSGFSAGKESAGPPIHIISEAPSPLSGLVSSEEVALDGDDDKENEDSEMVLTVLGILGGMLQMGSAKRSTKEEHALRGVILPALQMISSGDRNSFVSQTAADVALLIMIRGGAARTDRLSDEEADRSRSFTAVCDDAESYLNDPSPATRGLGVRDIIVALREPKLVRRHPYCMQLAYSFTCAIDRRSP